MAFYAGLISLAWPACKPNLTREAVFVHYVHKGLCNPGRAAGARIVRQILAEPPAQIVNRAF